MSDYVDRFEHAGYVCTIRKAPLEHLCGYVDIPPGHPWHGVGYVDIDADVHGGLTYSEEEEGAWRIGFDCAHSGDYVPGTSFGLRERREGEVYRTEAYVAAHCRSLAEQAAAAKEAT